MKTYGLIGRKLSHSFSKTYFENKFAREAITDCEYNLYELAQIDQLPELIKSQPGLRGLNVTVPYKEAIIPYLDGLDETARKVGAVNVVKVSANGTKLMGYNTDYRGFVDSLRSWLKNTDMKALVLGSGGAAKAVGVALTESGIGYGTVSRQEGFDFTYEQLKKDAKILTSHKLIVNTTPQGMYPAIEAKPELDYSLLTSNHYLYDLVYNPEITAFMQHGIEQGAQVKNGLEMLQLQAGYSWDIWTMESV